MPKTGCLANTIPPIVILLALLAGCAHTPPPPAHFDSVSPPSLPLGAEGLQPGLAVWYFDHPFVLNLNDLPQGEDRRKAGWGGPPIPYLNHQFGRSDVFDSGTNRGIAMELNGVIRLDKPGTYGFQANSNDGVRLAIGGQRLIDDASWHGDRLSQEAWLTISEPGWYALQILYFQRRGTATLQLYWQPPGTGTFAIVPAAALAHRPQ
jgi:hypothetical protein